MEHFPLNRNDKTEIISFLLQAYSLLEYTCGTVPDNAKGIVLGTVDVGSK